MAHEKLNTDFVNSRTFETPQIHLSRTVGRFHRARVTTNNSKAPHAINATALILPDQLVPTNKLVTRGNAKVVAASSSSIAAMTAIEFFSRCCEILSGT
jgi:hypothetical protein